MRQSFCLDRRAVFESQSVNRAHERHREIEIVKTPLARHRRHLELLDVPLGLRPTRLRRRRLGLRFWAGAGVLSDSLIGFYVYPYSYANA